MSEMNPPFDRILDNFIARIEQSGEVWGLSSGDGWVVCDSTEFEDSEVMPFWSSREEAQRHCVDEWARYRATAIGLEEFLDQWITGMSEDGVLVGPDWDADLEGIEVEPVDVARRLLRA